MRFITLIAVATLISGCGAAFTGQFAGYGSGNVAQCGGSVSGQSYLSLSLQENGNSVQGTFTSQVSGGTSVSGNVQGTVNGNNISVIMTPSSGSTGSYGSIQGQGTYNNNTITMQFTNTMCSSSGGGSASYTLIR